MALIESFSKISTPQFFIRRAYKVRENERRHNILASEAAERSSKTIESSEANSGNGQSVAEGESGLGRHGRSARSEAETGERSSEGRSAVSEGKEVAAPSLEGAKGGATEGEKPSVTGDVCLRRRVRQIIHAKRRLSESLHNPLRVRSLYFVMWW